MKINELLTELRFSKKKEIIRSDGSKVERQNYSEPRWIPQGKGETGAVLGTVGDWYTEMGVERHHIPAALEKVRHSPEYAKLKQLGFDETTNKAEEANGTMTFKGYHGEIVGDIDKNPRMLVKRKVLGNGSIRTTGLGASGLHGGRGNVPKPLTAKSHPDMSPVDRMAQSMRSSLAHLHKVQEPAFMNAFKKAMRHHAGKE